ncbi:MAG TPA: DUF4430 domain-containing protein [Patescibacteria group bacterium]|nr:DUF4430 domain-containing protein [Patescibacteria group bacterium]
MKKPLSPILVRLLAFLIFVVTFSGAYLLFSTDTSQPKINTTQQFTPTTTEEEPDQLSTTTKKPTVITNKVPTIEATDDPVPINPSSPIAPQIEINELVPEPVGVKIQIGDAIYSIQVAENTTLYNAMEKLANQRKITWQTKEYGSLGRFVDSLNGITSDRIRGKYWIFYINGETAKIGISSYILKNNDLIKWNYEDSKY